MRASELRIGNLLQSDTNKIIKIVGVVKKDIYYYHNKKNLYVLELNNLNFQPIPLTEEWLLKMGFEKSQEQWYTIKYFTDCDLATEQMAISYNLSSNRCAVFDAIEETDIVNILSYPIYTSKRVLYVHTLQNVFFALTGEELIIDHNEVR